MGVVPAGPAPARLAGAATASRSAHAVELASVCVFGALWLAQFVVCDRVLFAPRAPGAPATTGATATAEINPGRAICRD